MNKKKAAKRTYKVTLDSFKADLNAEKYGTATGARKAASYLSETDKAAALKLVAKHFGIGMDEPGPTGRKQGRASKKVAKKVEAKKVTTEAAKFVPTGGLGLPRKKRGRPRKNPEAEVAVVAEVAAAQPAEAVAPKKRRGRPPKAKVAVEAASEPIRTPEPAVKRQARKVTEGGALDQIGLIGRAMGPLESALKILERANQLANGQIQTTGFQDIADTAAAAVRALKPHVTAVPLQNPPPRVELPAQPAELAYSNGQVDRAYDPALLEAAALSAGIPLPGDDSVQ